ncbi:rho GTPase-activating protein 25 isoform X2 [Megalops cyprinoides]|uniref:rho GTPase-activating protein 25 isoform X2 n=1 Tax=Megalops cyprinoides TaxID=118141 RepID=UPI001864039F|nr:rho GTPase-activating protein 25 isoform X2 [Megalops cyprinoides]
MSLKLPRNWDFSTFRAETNKIARSKSVMPGEAGPGSCRPGSPRSAERPLKTGWLKKQRSIVKNWQQRYFVLRGHTLYYYKDDKDNALQGHISLTSSQVNELPANADDPGKFLFEITPGSGGDRERDSYVLMANSQNEMEEWVRTIRRVIGTSSGGVFGKSLGDTVTYEQRFGSHLVPILVQKCAEFIREHGLSEEGIFRLPGQDNQVKQFRDAFDAGERPSFPSDTDVHTVASLLKLYLRELPEPVIPWAQYQDLLDCSHELDPKSSLGRDKLEKQIALLPRANYNLLSYICRFLYEVQQNSKVNKMSVENLATVFGVNLLKPQIEDPITMMKGTPQIQKLMTVMIRQHEELFPPSKDVAPSPPSKKSDSKKPSVPRSFVGWDAAESETSPLSESPEEDGTLGTEAGDGEGSEFMPVTQALSRPPSSSAVDPWMGSPRKRTQTLPSSTSPCPSARNSCGLTHQGSLREPPSSPPLHAPDGDGEKRTLSEDIFKILDLQRVSLFKGTRGNDGDKAEKGREVKDGEGWVSGRKADDVVTAQPPEATKPTKPTKPSRIGISCVSSSSSSSPPQAQRDTSQEERTEGSSDRASSPEGKARSLGDNKGTSEELINSLQQKNRELSARVAELQTALDAEKRCVAALEIRLRNAERSRDEAQRRNQELDREIQEFLTRAPSGPP